MRKALRRLQFDSTIYAKNIVRPVTLVRKALLSSLALGRPASSGKWACLLCLFPCHSHGICCFAPACCHLTSVFALDLLLVVLLLSLSRRCFLKCANMLVFALLYHNCSCCSIFFRGGLGKVLRCTNPSWQRHIRVHHITLCTLRRVPLKLASCGSYSAFKLRNLPSRAVKWRSQCSQC